MVGDKQKMLRMLRQSELPTTIELNQSMRDIDKTQGGV